VKRVEGGVAAPQGYRAAGVRGGIHRTAGKKDCALVTSRVPASVAGVFTTNVVKAAPVLWDMEVCARGRAQAVFLNSGNANACTGPQGVRNVKDTAIHVGRALGMPPELVCIASTGVIGVLLPMDAVRRGVEAAVQALSETGGRDAAEAVMTTDRAPKEGAFEVALSSGPVRIGGMAKGAGMISPQMATMLCVITTDAQIEPQLLHQMLRKAVAKSFNCISVDNDMSTNDSVLFFANGEAGVGELDGGSEDFRLLSEALEALCEDLAQLLVRGGEGATKFVTIQVVGAPSDDAALRVARSVAHSQLCKTAFAGQDPNWGRVACAAGYAGVPFEPGALSIWLGGVQVMANGKGAVYREEDAAAVMRQPEFTVRISLGSGPGKTDFWTSDLSHEYVSINADYRS
jgi:glutamate N-acetyltransferase / amino-acid N-acetyltransferase